MTTSSCDTHLIDLPNGKRISVGALRRLLPTAEVALFFAKAYKLDYRTTSQVIRYVFDDDLIDVLFNGNHSTELQDYVIDLATFVPEHLKPEQPLSFQATTPPDGVLLPELWESAMLTVASSIEQVADKLSSTLDVLARSQQGQMTFAHMAKLNAKAPTTKLGMFGPRIVHPVQEENLVVLDVSYSMSEDTVRAIVDDVVALAYKANAHMAIVSTNSFYWAPGTYGTQDVLAKAEFMNTNYETLVDLFKRDWSTVVSIADYDSSGWAKNVFKRHATGRIGRVLDISLVNRPTFLSECLGVIADSVEPMLIANSSQVLN